MARTSSAVLAALLAAAPLAGAFAQAPAEQTPAPVTAPAAEGAAAPAETAPAAEAPAPAEAPATAEAPAPAASDTAAPAQPAGTAQPAAPAQSAGTAPAQTPAQDQVGSYYTKSTHGDWQLRCLRTQDGKDPCELYQLLRDDQQTPVAEISVVPFSGEAAAIMNFVAPLETNLEAGMGLQIDAGKNNRYPFMVCAPIGCVSRIGMSQAELDSFKRGSKATVSLLPFGGTMEENLVRLNVSLSGFTAGFDELVKVLEAAK
ncbi:invasion associated locus B family protein [Paracoccus chinensis]|uniref:Invasion protein IalB, involved in pathogenesis n=1 Tax=Paracoccus chinensis TaxID=525640 RepID=A0A1G9H3L4_9RHOB|nr:invasion associated locus B family protein [Paracoccus chinensis]SDL07435.1 Invasion protein IalB, involved in pathogenesis [Paracoccus chinensis]